MIQMKPQSMNNLNQIMERLRSQGNPTALAGMARFGISTHKAYGISLWDLRKLAKEIETDHTLAAQLWATGVHEARILASIVDDPRQVDEAQMESWVSEFDSWDICDQVCDNLFGHTPYAWAKAVEWSSRPEEFVKRAGFVLMCVAAVHHKRAGDQDFEVFFPLIVREANDDRPYVKKAVNWALRQIGKRNLALNARAIQVAQQVQALGSRPARWIASDALRELSSQTVQERLHAKTLGKPPRSQPA
jgi:3-methyladenine DNA glycosylase AlkD